MLGASRNGCWRAGCSSPAPWSLRTEELAGLAYDARYATAESSGIGQMCQELLRGLAGLRERPTLRVLVNQQTRLSEDLWDNENLYFCEAPWAPSSLANQIHLPGFLKQRQIQLLHSVDSYNPLAAQDVRFLVNVHDLIPLTEAGRSSKCKKVRFRLLWKAWLRLQCRRANKIVSGSRHSADDILRLLRIEPDKLRIIPTPVREWAEVESVDRFRERFRLPGRVISYVGRHEPYKNIVSLIRAVRLIIDAEKDNKIRLVVAGSLDPRYPEARRVVDTLGLNESVILTGYLSDASLGALYQLSDVFVCPSLYEGFGMPPLEAMRFGTPVVAARRASLPEVLGNAAYFVDPENPSSIAQGITATLKDSVLRQRLRLAGPEQARLYSRERAARQYLDLYRELLLEPFLVSPAPTPNDERNRLPEMRDEVEEGICVPAAHI